MRYLFIVLFVFVIQAGANQSPRYQALVDSTIEKKPFSQLITTPVQKFREKGAAIKPAAAPRKKKGVSTTITYPLKTVDSSLIELDKPLPCQVRNSAGMVLLYDIPETPIDSIRLHELTFDSSSLVDSSQILDSIVTDTLVAEVSTTIEEGDVVGNASWYGPGFQGKKTSSGERFDMHKMTAAHRTLPFGTIVEITNIATGRSIRVRINDRGPHRKDRMIDLSKKAGQKIGAVGSGVVKVKMRVIQ